MKFTKKKLLEMMRPECGFAEIFERKGEPDKDLMSEFQYPLTEYAYIRAYIERPGTGFETWCNRVFIMVLNLEW